MFTTNKQQQLFICSLLITATLLLVSLLLPHKVSAATIEVNSTADTQANDGECTLREAIVAANTNTVSGAAANECIAGDSGADTINFNISGSQVHTITPSTALPTITEQLTIDGYSQPGAEENTAVAPLPLNGTIKIEVDLSAVEDDGIDVQADDSVIRGLAIYSNSVGRQIKIAANDSVFQGNYSGFRADGMTFVKVDVDIEAQEAATLVQYSQNYSGCVIGGTDPEDRNVFGSQPGTTAAGSVSVGNHPDCVIKGNYFGLAKDGVTTFSEEVGEITNPLAGSSALGLGGGGTTVGGGEEGAMNVFSGSETSQLTIGQGSGFVVQGNYFGTDYTGSVDGDSINGLGIIISADVEDSLIGGTSAGEGNLIAGVSGVGIAVIENYLQPFESGAAPDKVSIIGNSINEVGVFALGIFGDSNLGIDLFKNVVTSFVPLEAELTNQGPTLNDVNDVDVGANGHINTPVLKTAQQVGNQLTITYDLDADDAEEPANQYRVEFFANDESSIFGYGPGETYLGAVTTTPGTDKTAVLTVSGDHTNKALSSTTTAVDSTTASGFGSTSEFSQNISIGSASDFDSDGAPDSIEDGAPNGGDGNNDGTPDSQQPTVSSFLDYDGTHYITFIAEGCSENGTVASIDASTLGVSDNGYTYPHGMNDFELNCSRGDTVDITIYTHDPSIDISSLLPRKFNPNTNVYTDLNDSNLQRETVGTSNAIKLTYSITDGGLYDDDNEANGIIVDPVGLATELTEDSTVGAPNTGLQQYWVLDIKG